MSGREEHIDPVQFGSEKDPSTKPGMSSENYADKDPRSDLDPGSDSRHGVKTFSPQHKQTVLSRAQNAAAPAETYIPAPSFPPKYMNPLTPVRPSSASHQHSPGSLYYAPMPPRARKSFLRNLQSRNDTEGNRGAERRNKWRANFAQKLTGNSQQDQRDFQNQDCQHPGPRDTDKVLNEMDDAYQGNTPGSFHPLWLDASMATPPQVEVGSPHTAKGVTFPQGTPVHIPEQLRFKRTATYPPTHFSAAQPRRHSLAQRIFNASYERPQGPSSENHESDPGAVPSEEAPTSSPS